MRASDRFISDDPPAQFDRDEFVLTVRHGLLGSRVAAHDPEGNLLCSAVRSRRWLVYAGYWIGAAVVVVGWPVGLISLQMWLTNAYGPPGWVGLLLLFLAVGGLPVLFFLAKRFYPVASVTLYRGNESEQRFGHSWIRSRKIRSGTVYGETLALLDENDREIGCVSRSGRDGTNYSFWMEEDRSDLVRFDPERRTRKRDLAAVGVLGLGLLGRRLVSNQATGKWFIVRARNAKLLGSLTPRTSRKEYSLDLSGDTGRRLDRRMATVVAMLLLVTPSNER